MLVGRGREWDGNRLHFLLSRNGEVTYHWMDLDFDNKTRTIIWTRPTVGELNFGSEEERQYFEARCVDLKDALRTYKAGGCYETPLNAYETVVFENI